MCPVFTCVYVSVFSVLLLDGVLLSLGPKADDQLADVVIYFLDLFRSLLSRSVRLIAFVGSTAPAAVPKRPEGIPSPSRRRRRTLRRFPFGGWT